MAKTDTTAPMNSARVHDGWSYTVIHKNGRVDRLLDHRSLDALMADFRAAVDWFQFTGARVAREVEGKVVISAIELAGCVRSSEVACIRYAGFRDGGDFDHDTLEIVKASAIYGAQAAMLIQADMQGEDGEDGEGDDEEGGDEEGDEASDEAAKKVFG